MSQLLFRLFHHGIEFPLDCKRDFINPRWTDLRPLLYLWTSWSNLFVPDICHLKTSKHVLSSTSQPLRWLTLIKFIRQHGQRQAAESTRCWRFLFAQTVAHWMRNQLPYTLKPPDHHRMHKLRGTWKFFPSSPSGNT